MEKQKPINFDGIKKFDKNGERTDHWNLISNALINANLKIENLNVGNNQKIFESEFTKLVCDTYLITNDLGDFQYRFLITRDGEWIKGEYVEYRCRDLPVANKVKACDESNQNCNLIMPPKPKEIAFKLEVAMLEVSDRINEFCLAQVFCGDQSLQEYINLIKKNLRDAINIKLEEWVEQNFSNEENYKDYQIITIKKDSTEKEVVKEIRKAYQLLRKKNQLNWARFRTRAMPENIYGFININYLVDYEMILACCQNAESRLGSLYNRLFPVEFIDKAGVPIENIVGVIFDKDIHPVQLGYSELYEVACPQRPWEKKQQLAIQVVADMIGCSSAILIKYEDSDADDQVQVDNQLVSYEDPTTSTLTYDNIKKTSGTATAEELGITKPTGGTGTTDTYEITGTDATAKTVNVKVTVIKNKTTKTKDIVIKASDAGSGGDDQDQIDANNQAKAYRDVTSTLTYDAMKKDVGTATATELGITKPAVSTGTTDTYNILSKDDGAKTVSVRVDVAKNGKTANKTITIKGSDAAFLAEKKFKK